MGKHSESDRERQNLPTYRQMARYGVVGGLFTIFCTPLLYAKWMKRSPLPWLSSESFEGFGWFVLVVGVLITLVLIGSHGDTEA